MQCTSTWQQKLGPRYEIVIYWYLLLYTRKRFLSISDFLPAVSVPFDTFCGQCTIHEGVLTRFEDRSKRSSRFCRLLDRLSPDFILKSGRIEIHPNTLYPWKTPLSVQIEEMQRLQIYRFINFAEPLAFTTKRLSCTINSFA